MFDVWVEMGKFVGFLHICVMIYGLMGCLCLHCTGSGSVVGDDLGDLVPVVRHKQSLGPRRRKERFT